MKNRAYHHGIKCSPYEAMFGQSMKCGLRTSNLPDDVIANITTAEELEALISATLAENATIDDTDDGDAPPVVGAYDPDFVDESPESSILSIRNQPSEDAQASDYEQSLTSHVQSIQMLDADTEVHTVSASDLSTRVPIPEEETHETSNTITQAPPEDVIAEQSPTFSLLDVSATENLDTLPSEQPESILSCDELEDESNSARSLESSDSAQSTALAQSLTVDEAAEAQLRKWTIISKRKLAKENLQQQASKMLRLSNSKFTPASIGDSVRIPVPEVDRSKCAARNVIGVVMDINDDKMYKIGTSQGVLKNLFTRVQFDVCKESFLNPEDVPVSSTTSVREAHGKTAVTESQGYERCNCKTGCNNNICKCLREARQCNSKCHGSLSCTNK